MRYLQIKNNDVLNGDGLRITIFVSGCDVHCEHCHNPESWDFNCGNEFTEKEENYIFKQLKKPTIDGITFTGGHPLAPQNIETITDLCKKIKTKFPNKTIWLYTGYLYENIKSLDVMQYVDVLVDGPYIHRLRNLTKQWCGSENQRVIDLNKTRELNKIVLKKEG